MRRNGVYCFTNTVCGLVWCFVHTKLWKMYYSKILPHLFPLFFFYLSGPSYDTLPINITLLLYVYFTHILCADNSINDGCNWGKTVAIIVSKIKFSSNIYYSHEKKSDNVFFSFILYLIWKILSHSFVIQTTVISYYMPH